MQAIQVTFSLAHFGSLLLGKEGRRGMLADSEGRDWDVFDVRCLRNVTFLGSPWKGAGFPGAVSWEDAVSRGNPDVKSMLRLAQWNKLKQHVTGASQAKSLSNKKRSLKFVLLLL